MRGKKTLCAVALIGVIAGLLVGGCGGSSSAEPMNKSQFVREANSICRSADVERNEALEKAADGDPRIGELAIDALQPVEEMTEELAELSAPVGGTSEVEAIVRALEASIEEVRADPTAPTAAIAAFAKPNELAEGYGLTECMI